MFNYVMFNCMLLTFFQLYLDPPERLKECLKSKGIAVGQFVALKHGETRHFGDGLNHVD